MATLNDLMDCICRLQRRVAELEPSGGGDPYTAGDFIDITDNVISVTASANVEQFLGATTDQEMATFAVDAQAINPASIGATTPGTIAGTTGSFTGDINQIKSGRIDNRFQNTSGNVDEKIWDYSIDGSYGSGTFALVIRNDADSLTGAVWVAARTGGSLGHVAFPSGNILIGTTINAGGKLQVAGDLKLASYTVATLPSAVTAGVKSHVCVTDLLTPVFGAAPTGGGAVVAHVTSNGTTWACG